MPQVPGPITDWGTAIISSVTTALMLLFAAIPRIIGFLVIVLVGWLIASAIAGAIAFVLRRIRFNEVADRAGVSGFVTQSGLAPDASGLLATLVKWFIMLIVLIVGFDNLGLPAVSAILNQFVFWLPNLFVALIVLVLGGLAANVLARLVRGAVAESGVADPDLLAGVTRVAVWAFAIIIALSQIGVATTIVNALFIGIVAALALALGLAFGLGGRETAAQIIRDWYARAQTAAARAPRPAGSYYAAGAGGGYPGPMPTQAAERATTIHRIAPGFVCVGSDGNRIGTVKDTQDAYFRCDTGILGLGRDLCIPYTAVDHVADQEVHVNVPSDRVGQMNWNCPQ